MAKFWFIVLLLVCSFCLQAQINLVPNPSFEDTLGCPQFYPDLNGKVVDWYSFRGTPDYFNICSSGCGYNNQTGYQLPRTGVAYVGVATYAVAQSDVGEHLGIKLNSKLKIGDTYYLSFYTSMAYEFIQVNIASSKIGALLMTQPYYDTVWASSLQNHALIYANKVITDSIGWTKISCSFVADSAYEYLAIGNFFVDSLVDTLHMPYFQYSQVAYYYIDDVCLSTDSNLCNVGSTVSEIFMDDPIINFNNGNLSISNLKNHNNLSISIYNTQGQIVFVDYTLKNDESYQTQITLSEGIYLLDIIYYQTKRYSKKVLNFKNN